MKDRKRITILTARRSQASGAPDIFRDALQGAMDEAVQLRIISIHDLVFINDEQTDTIYDKISGAALEECDLVVFRDVYGSKYRDKTGACASYLKRRSISYISSMITPNTASKYSAQVLRQAAGLIAIPSVYGTNETLAGLISGNLMPFDYPLVIKDVIGRKGQLNFIAHNEQEAIQVLTQHEHTQFIIQRYIENDGDYRVVVMGDEVELIILRRAVAGTHLNNTSQGAQAIVVDSQTLDSRILDDARQAARIEGLEVAGVDMIIDKQTGQPYVMEVNAAPQLATGAFGELKIAAYARYLEHLLDK
jgi:glutathione synthase/RimK-type ligase-like ATP-grasp enzyme